MVRYYLIPPPQPLLISPENQALSGLHVALIRIKIKGLHVPQLFFEGRKGLRPSGSHTASTTTMDEVWAPVLWPHLESAGHKKHLPEAQEAS